MKAIAERKFKTSCLDFVTNHVGALANTWKKGPLSDENKIVLLAFIQNTTCG